MGRRWDTDERGHGVASGEAFAPNVSELVAAMGDPAWVAEDPEQHLLHHLVAACSEEGAHLGIASAHSESEVFVVELTPRDHTASIGELRRAALELVATIAEDSTHIRQRRRDGLIECDVVTGTVASERFTPHGHLLQLRIQVPPGA
jgi:hypothetical protein